MSEFYKFFIKEENGAVTVDWVVLCAVMVGLCVGVAMAMETEVGQLASDVAATLEDWDVTGATASAANGTAGG